MQQEAETVKILIVGDTTYASVALLYSLLQEYKELKVTVVIESAKDVFEAIKKAAEARKEKNDFHFAFVDSRLDFLDEYLKSVDVQRKESLDFSISERDAKKIVRNFMHNLKNQKIR
jgi:hypothetical protein